MPIRSLCFSPDSQLLLTASDDGHMKLYDVYATSDCFFFNFLKIIYRQHTNVVGTLSGHASWVLSVAFAPDGKHFVSGSSDKTVKVWEFASKACVHTFKEHHDQVIWTVFLNSLLHCCCRFGGSGSVLTAARFCQFQRIRA